MSQDYNAMLLGFIDCWNAVQGQDTPEIHLKIAEWLQDHVDDGDQQLLLMAFRGCGKSTLMGLFCAWLLAGNPDMRILVLSADDRLAMRMVRNVRRIIERHPNCVHLRPDHPDQWASDRFTVKRPTELRDPSMMAAGIGGNITGMRADLIICDDVEVPNTSDTADKREELRARLHELDFIKASGARMIYVGTPHAFDTIYATELRDDVPGHVPFLLGYQALHLPVVDMNGKSTWPDKFPRHVIDDLRARVGHRLFQSQMMLVPMKMAKIHLDPAWLDVYDHHVTTIKEVGKTVIGDAEIISCSAWWDPALATGTGDASVLAVVFVDAEGHVYLHRLAYIDINPDVDNDIATAQCRVVADIIKELRVPVVGVETNGIGRLLPGILRRQMALAHVRASVVEVNHRDAKDIRIVRAFETLLAARMMHVHRSVLDTPFMDEMRDFRMGRKHGRDDGLDAAAGAITMEPIRLPFDHRPRTTFRTTHFLKGTS